MTTDPDIRYPIGPFTAAAGASVRTKAIDDVAALPGWIRHAVAGLSDAQLDTPYRPDGWTVRQVVHHVADSHMNGFIRLKLTLTEDSPTIKPYEEKRWAELADTALPVGVSLNLLECVHTRWHAVYRGMDPSQFSRTFYHPEIGETMTLDRHVQLYAWHSRHHVAHITSLRARRGW